MDVFLEKVISFVQFSFEIKYTLIKCNVRDLKNILINPKDLCEGSNLNCCHDAAKDSESYQLVLCKVLSRNFIK